MTGTASTIDARPSAAGAGASALPSELRVRLLEAVGLESLTAAEGAVPAAPDPARAGSWQERLSRACAPHPLRLRPVFLSITEAVGAAAARTPLVGYSESAGWFLLLDRVQGRTLLAGVTEDRDDARIVGAPEAQVHDVRKRDVGVSREDGRRGGRQGLLPSGVPGGLEAA